MRYWLIRLRLKLLLCIGRFFFDAPALLKASVLLIVLLTVIDAYPASMITLAVHAVHIFLLVFVLQRSCWALLFTGHSGLKIMQVCLDQQQQDPQRAIQQFLGYLRRDNPAIAAWAEEQLQQMPAQVADEAKITGENPGQSDGFSTRPGFGRIVFLLEALAQKSFADEPTLDGPADA